MLVAAGIIPPPTIATVSSMSAAEIKEEQTENGRAASSRDQEEQLDVVKTDQPAPAPPITRKRKLVDLERLANESKGQETKAYDELDAYSKRIKFDTLAANQSFDNQFLSTSSHSNRMNGPASDYPASLCYS